MRKTPSYQPKCVVAVMGKAGAGKDTVADLILSRVGYGIKYSFADPLKEMCSEVFDIPIEWMYDQDLKKKEVIINFENEHTIQQMEAWVLYEISNVSKWAWLVAHPDLSGSGFGLRYQQVAKTLLDTFENILKQQNYEINLGYRSVYRLSIRKMLQLMGTEVIRNHVSDTFWAEIKKPTLGMDTVIIPDCRFETELDYVMSFDNHVVVVVENDDLDCSATNGHSSEDLVDRVAEYLKHTDTKPLYIKNNLQGDYDALRETVETQVIPNINFETEVIFHDNHHL